MDVKGKLLKKMPVASGQSSRGKWEKQEFIIETNEQYPKKIMMSVWGDKISIIEKVAEGDTINVSFNLESREYNGRWYTDVRAWRIERTEDEGFVPPPIDELSPESEESGNDLPF